MAIASLIVGIAATLFAVLAWLTARQRQPFTLKRDGNLALLTRARRPTVQIRRVFVFGHSQLITRDQAATTEWRILSRDRHLVLSLGESVGGDEVAPVHPSETVTVEYRRVWPWDAVAPRPWLPRRRLGPAGSKAKMMARREKLDSNEKAGVWKQWYSSLL